MPESHFHYIMMTYFNLGIDKHTDLCICNYVRRKPILSKLRKYQSTLSEQVHVRGYWAGYVLFLCILLVYVFTLAGDLVIDIKKNKNKKELSIMPIKACTGLAILGIP